MLDAVLTFVGTFLLTLFASIMLFAGVETYSGGPIEPAIFRKALAVLIPVVSLAVAFLRTRRARKPQANGETVPSREQARRAAEAARSRPAKGPARDFAADLAAEFQAQAKRSDDAHKARIRAHVERQAPLTGDADRAAVALAARACLAIRHVFPPRHPQRLLSFLGGVPLAPAEALDWPMIHNREGLLEPLTFMGQIDLGALPDGPARSLLPGQGYLYFFAPMSGNFDRSADHFVVRHVAAKAGKDWGPQHNPGMLEPIDGVADARYRYPWLNWHDKPEKAYPRSYPRIEIELGWLDDVGEVEEGDADAADGFPWEVARARRRRQLVDFHGAPVASDPILSWYGKPLDRLWIPFDGFPTNRRTAEILLGFVKSYIKEETIAIKAALDPLPAASEEQERARLSALLDRYVQFDREHWQAFTLATSGGISPGKPLDEAQRGGILALLEQLHAGALPEAVAKRAHMHKQLPMALNEWISTAAIEGAEAALADPEGGGQVPEHIVAAIRYRHSVLRDRFSENGEYAQHQMLGHGDVIQVAAEEMAHEYILLLQLRPDDALGWHMGDYGALQYWIHPADLAARRFENTVLTFESH